MRSLTKAEEEVMQILWEVKEAAVKELIEHMPEPKPAYNTVSTIIRILETKEVVGHRKKGKGYIYFPLIEKEEYSQNSLNKLVTGYFDGSFKSMVSFFMNKNDVNTKELDEILKMIEDKKENND
ncbi:MAG: BlaI/MecI/CopY family transcriptional regulator [Bacteroidota bacterium]